MIKQIEQNGQQILRTRAGVLVASQSEPGAWYGVADVDGVLCCECPGFKHRGACKHVRAIRDLERAEMVAHVERTAAERVAAAPILASYDERRRAAVAAIADLFD